MNSNRFSGFSVGSRPRGANRQSAGSFSAVPPPPTASSFGSRFSRPGTSSNSLNRFPPPSGLSGVTIPPHLSTISSTNKQGYSTLSAISQTTVDTNYGLPTSRPKTEDEYNITF